MSVFSDQLHQSGEDHSLHLWYVGYVTFILRSINIWLMFFFGKPNSTTRFMKMVVWIKPFKTLPRFVFHQHCVSREPLLLCSKDTWAVFGCALSLVAVQNLWIMFKINILPSPLELDSFFFVVFFVCFKLDSIPHFTSIQLKIML